MALSRDRLATQIQHIISSRQSSIRIWGNLISNPLPNLLTWSLRNSLRTTTQSPPRHLSALQSNRRIGFNTTISQEIDDTQILTTASKYSVLERIHYSQALVSSRSHLRLGCQPNDSDNEFLIRASSVTRQRLKGRGGEQSLLHDIYSERILNDMARCIYYRTVQVETKTDSVFVCHRLDDPPQQYRVCDRLYTIIVMSPIGKPCSNFLIVGDSLLHFMMLSSVRVTCRCDSFSSDKSYNKHIVTLMKKLA